MNNEKGMTLIEVLMVIVIIAVLASLAIPSFQRMIERQQIRQAVESLKADTQLARISAIKQSANVILARNTGAAGAWCYGAATVTCDCTETVTTEADYCSIYRVDGGQYNATSFDSVGANTTFSFRRGTADANDTCISTANFTLKVSVNNAGKVNICSDSTAPVDGYYDNCASNC